MKKVRCLLVALFILSFMFIEITSKAVSAEYSLMDKRFKLNKVGFEVCMYGNTTFHYSQPHTMDTVANYLTVYVAPILSGDVDYYEDADIDIKIPKCLKIVYKTDEPTNYSERELKARKQIKTAYIKVTVRVGNIKQSKKIKIKIIK